MYTSCPWSWRRLELTATSITHHHRPYHEFLDNFHFLVAKEVTPTGEIPPDMLDRLLHYIVHNDNLRVAWDYLATRGGQAAGRNGHRYQDYSSNETWGLLRQINQALKSGTYRPGPERVVEIPKSSGVGTRTLRLLNIEDRVVQRAILQILQPLYEPTFSRLSFGYRPRLDRRHALATAQRLTRERGLDVWIVDDIADCFDHIPCGRLLQVLRRRLPADVLELVGLTCTAGRKQGVRQGAPLSPWLVNVYLDHFLDRPWQRDHPEAPLLRTADDILVLASSRERAERLYDELSRRLRSAGVPLKGRQDEAIRELERGDKANWLGFQVTATPTGLATELAERSWSKLEQAFATAHEKPLAARVADQIVDGWLAQAAPCHGTLPLPQLIARVRGLAREYGFEELQANWWFAQQWARAVGVWQHMQLLAADTSVTSGDEETFDCECASAGEAPF